MRLEVMRKSDLAVRAMIELGRGQSRLKSAELAEMLSASKDFMSQAMIPVVKRGWVGSDPGPTGGYHLLVDLEDVTLGDVIEEVEGPIDAVTCVVSDRPCSEDGPCVFHHTWEKARTVLTDELSSTSLARAGIGGGGGALHDPTNTKKRNQ